MQFAGFPRVRLAALPTPIEELANLSKVLGGPRLFVKRDDNTGLAFGGNKARKLEFLIGEALEKGADTVITVGGVQSNHARQTVAAANKAGLKTILVLKGEEPRDYKANLLLDGILGAEVRFVQADSYQQVDQAAYEVSLEVEKAGGIPYIIPLGGNSPTGCLGYVAAVLEILAQVKEKELWLDYMVTAAGSGTTQTGLILGTKATNSKIKVLGISVSRSKDILMPGIVELGNQTAAKLGIDVSIIPEDVKVSEEYIGEGYAIPTKECVEAIKLLAKIEGLLLDPVYTGKAMAGLIDLIKRDTFRKDENVLFIHTGGTPALFADESIFRDP